MEYKVQKSQNPNELAPQLYLLSKDQFNLISELYPQLLFKDEEDYLKNLFDKKIYFIRLPRLKDQIFIQIINKDFTSFDKEIEEYRLEGVSLQKTITRLQIESLSIVFKGRKELLLALAEGFLLSNYRFQKYKTEKENLFFEKLILINDEISEKDFDILKIIVESVFTARDLINEPGSDLTATVLAEKALELGKESGFYVEIFNKAKIESLKMGGLLAVNKGSIEPPTFSILEWKPDLAKGKAPIVLVGKGVMFDTGGLSLKPTLNSMDYMKCDMSGAAAVISILSACAKLKLNLHVIGLIPATDNRPGEMAYFPGDVIQMYDSTTVEVLNTDAEGRMILADALSYAKKYNPELVIDIATLTGSASAAIGKAGMVGFFKTNKEVKEQLIESSFLVNERIVEFPLWDDYADLIKSDVADVKNIGGAEAGAITAAKFLERFTDYPWIHLDIAGVAFNQKENKYHGKGGAGITVRLIINYFIKLSEKN